MECIFFPRKFDISTQAREIETGIPLLLFPSHEIDDSALKRATACPLTAFSTLKFGSFVEIRQP
jgi:hypothetical protein